MYVQVYKYLKDCTMRAEHLWLDVMKGYGKINVLPEQSSGRGIAVQ